MTKDNLLDELYSLQQELILLNKEVLPVKTRAAIQKARESIRKMEASLRENKESGKLGALYKVSQSLGNSLNLDEVLTQVMDAVIQLTGAERGFLTLIDPDTGELQLRAGRNIEQDTLERKDMEISRTVVQSVINSGKGVVTTDAQNDPRFSQQDSVILYSLRSILCAPLKVRGKINGVIYVDNRARTNIFTENDLELLSAFSNQAGVAIENARSYRRTDQALAERVAELETLSQFDMQINENLDLDRVIGIIHEWIFKGANISRCWVTLTEDESKLQRVVSQANTSETDFLKACVFPHITDDPTPKAIPMSADAQTFLISPMLLSGKIVGSIIAEPLASFSNREIQFLKRLAARSSIAIENAKLYQAVQRANEAKSQFVSLVTHELRIPLTSIKGYTDLIIQGVVGQINEQQLEFLNVIGNNVDRMAALISDLSDISRIERGILKLEKAPSSLQDCIDETLKALRHKIKEKKQTFTIDVPDSLPYLYTDPNRLVQVLTNLVSNACKYTPEGGKINLSANHADSKVIIEVRDNGIGISVEDQTKLYTQFFRSEAPLVREQIGWGLGLNVTKRLVELMGGEIGMSSKLGEGSNFWFSLSTRAEESESNIPNTPS